MLSYDIYAFGRMIRDEVRTGAYAEALRRSVTKDSVVLDLGTGVGIWALLACKFGARKVYAIDPNDVIQVGRELAAVNGVADRIEFIQKMSTEIALPELADVLVVEMHGNVPMFEQNLPSIIDARERLLKPNATLIPQRETLWAAPAEATESFDHVARPWCERPYGFDWNPAMRVAANDWFRNKAKSSVADLLSEPQCWATLDFRTLTTPNVRGEITWTANRDGTGHGVLVWFDSALTDEIGFSNAPGMPDTIFGQAFFPWIRPVPIAEGDTISVGLRCDLVDTYHLWRWKTVIRANNKTEPKAEFAQSSFVHMPLALSDASRGDADYKPKLNPQGELQHFILSRMNGSSSVRVIAAEARDKFPEIFRDDDAARKKIADLASKYSNGR